MFVHRRHDHLYRKSKRIDKKERKKETKQKQNKTLELISDCNKIADTRLIYKSQSLSFIPAKYKLETQNNLH